MPRTPTAAVAAAGLVGGFAAARYSGRRELGGALFAALGAWNARTWVRELGAAPAAGLTALYVAAMGGSHPLAKSVGAWPAVGAVTAVTAGVAFAAADRRAR